MDENQISNKIIGVAIELHKILGPGLLESVYEKTFSFELKNAGLRIRNQVPVPLVYKDIHMDAGFKIDILVEEKVVIELKAIEALAPVHYAQLLTYLRITKLKLGLLINFNVPLMREGIHRVVNNL
jgi:GxxExxY protein